MASLLEDSGQNADEMRPEYRFRELKGVVRGKYAERYRRGRLRVVRLEKDVAEAFRDEAAVNEALREYLRQRRSP
jgi:hypothetical protein